MNSQIARRAACREGKSRSAAATRVPTAFVSYSWDSEARRTWVRNFAARLRADGVEMMLDRWEVAPGDQLPTFMERAVRENDYVLVVCTPSYMQRSDGRTGGAEYQGDIMTGEIFNSPASRKFIPVLRDGDRSAAIPSWLGGRYFIDLTGTDGSDRFEMNYCDLLTSLHGEREQAPRPLRRPARRPPGRGP